MQLAMPRHNDPPGVFSRLEIKHWGAHARMAPEREAKRTQMLLMTLGLLLLGLIWLSNSPQLPGPGPLLYRATAATSTADENFIVYLSDTTYAHFRTVGGDYESLVAPWRRYFAASKAKVEFTRDLKALDKRLPTTLILPSAVSLSATERAKILAFYNRGGSILATWAAGTWSGPGQWAGWDFIKALGGNVVGESSANSGQFLIVRGETPISFGIDAGERISLSPASEDLVLYKPDSSSAARLVNWARLADPAIQEKNSVVQFKEAARTQGRVVLFGFSENSWDADSTALFPLIDNSLSWLMRRPTIVLAAWPDAHPAAHVLEMDTEEGFPTADYLAALAKSKNVPVSFFVLTSVAAKYPEVLRRLSQEHEIALHGDVHDGFRGQSAQTQFKRIRTAQTDLDRLLGPNPNRAGFRPPREEYDKATESVLLENGILYEVIDPDSTNGRLPFVAKQSASDASKILIALPRTQRDDLNLLAASRDPVVLEKALIDDLNVIADNGGLVVLSIHSQNFGQDSPLAKALPPYLDYLDTMRKRIWLTDTGAVARWWRDRSRIALQSTIAGDAVDLKIVVSGTAPVEGVSLIVMTPERGVAPKISATTAGLPKPTVEVMDPLRYRLKFPGLTPRQYSYRLTF